MNGIAVTWATPVDAAELGARMESYVDTKASVHVFKLCAQHAQPGAPLGRLSSELIEMIATEIQDAAFDKQLKAWQQSIRCCAQMCRPSEHLDEEVRERLREDFLTDEHELGHEDSDCVSLDYFDEYAIDQGMGYDEHMEAVEAFLAQVEDNSYIESSGRFAKCRKVCSSFPNSTMETEQSAQAIAEDFGLEAYFTAFRDFEITEGWAYPSATAILAYLILPSMHSTLRTSSGSDMVSYLSSVIVDASILHSNPNALFKVAMCTLQLEPVPLGQHFTSVVPTSEPLPFAHGHSWYCSKHKEIRDEAARKEAYTSC